VLSVYSIIFTG